MTIDTIQITNFKNYEYLEVHFEKGVNLFVGANGSGKTSILEAINVALGGYFSLQESKMQRMIELSEVRIVMAKGQPIRATEASIIAYSETIGKSWSRSFNSITKNNDKKNVKPAGEYGEAMFAALSDSTPNIVPLIAYYSTQRLFKDAYQSAKQKYDPLAGRRNGYLQCLKDNAIKGTLVDWLGSAVTDRATKKIQGIKHNDVVLENVEKAIITTLSYFLEDTKEEDIKIYQEAQLNFELFLQIKSDFALPLSSYSDGFRNIMYLIIDLVWRASQLNPWLTLSDMQDKQLGCVTIDEIDLHLHPKWQAKAIGILQKLFPKVQFFITTHSPTVVANFEKGTLYVISNDVVLRQTEKYFGKEINAVLRNILGANDRHVPTQQKVDLLLTLIDDNPHDVQISSLIEELIEQIGEDDPDIQKALSLWEFSLHED